MSLPDPRIRAVALGLAVRSGHVLAESYAASPGRVAFLRALGGGIDFGETGAEALARSREHAEGWDYEGWLAARADEKALGG